jgi:uncharacterized protein YdeI (YjbR/CyaY-like superfamily)
MATAARARRPGTRSTATQRRPKRAKRAVSRPTPAVEAPRDLEQALQDDPAARKAYLAMPPSHRRAYVEFVEEAKRPETRVRRMQQALRMMAQWGTEHAKRGAKRR